MLVRWLGVSHKVGQAIPYWILLVSGTVISCNTVQILTLVEKATEECKIRMEYYDTKVEERLSVKDSYLSKQVQNIDLWNKLSIADQDPEFLEELNQFISDTSIPDGPDDYTNSNVGKISESPNTVPEIHYQEVVPSDAHSTWN